MKAAKNIHIASPTGRPILLDYFYKEDQQPKPVVIFCHGFKGFKDWGHFNFIAEKFAKAGLCFVKFNFSHNGTTVDHPDEFHDLNGFALNNFSKELDDLGAVMDWIESNLPAEEIKKSEFYLIGHSRGGGIAILKASEEVRVKKLVTWASVSDFEKVVNPKNLDEWREKGIIYMENARTHQLMPVDFQLYDDYYFNEERLNIKSAIKKLSIPVLIIHGGVDEVVKPEHAERLKHWNKSIILEIIENENHTFGVSHPFTPPLPPGAEKVTGKTINFLNNKNN
jgi:uncharacterized protein